jgi:hypothetical protein
MTYGRTIRWTDFDGTKHELSVGDCASIQEATQAVIDMAKKSGWRPPRWWEFWRWGDTTARQLLR